jgi:hypothetical protein
MVSLSRADAQRSDQAAVYEALFSQVESLGLDKTYYVREREGRFSLKVVGDYPVSFPDELVLHALEDFGSVSVSFVDESFVFGLWESGCRAGWESFHRRYPLAGELTQISQVLFSESGDEAFVYLEQGSGCQSSCGITYRLTTEAGQWSVAGRLGGWCS